MVQYCPYTKAQMATSINTLSALYWDYMNARFEKLEYVLAAKQYRLFPLPNDSGVRIPADPTNLPPAMQRKKNLSK